MYIKVFVFFLKFLLTIFVSNFLFQTALHTPNSNNQQQQFLEPRMAQLETLEAKVRLELLIHYEEKITQDFSCTIIHRVEII